MRQLIIATVAVLSTLAGLAVLWELRGAVMIFFLSLGTSAALRPAIEQLERWRVPKSLALALTYLGCLGVFLGLVLALLFPLANDLHQLGRDFKDSYQQMSKRWPQGTALERAVAHRLPAWEDLERGLWGTSTDAADSGKSATDNKKKAKAKTKVEASDDNPIASLNVFGDLGWTSEDVRTLLGVTWGFFGSIINSLIIVVLSLYWSIDRVHFERLWLSLLDVGKRQRARDTWRAIEQATGAYLQREAGQSLAAGLMLGFGFWAYGQPYPVLSAAIAALAWLIPWIGAVFAMLSVTAVWLPSYVLDRGTGMVLLAPAIYTLVVLVLLEWLVEPRLFRHKRHNPILLVLVAVGMVDWLGLLGLLIAPPVAATVQILGQQFLTYRSHVATSEVSPHALALRLSTLRAQLADRDDLPADTETIVERLESLVQQARSIFGTEVATVTAPGGERPQ